MASGAKIPWLVVAVVGPSLVLSLAGFWALHVQDRLNQEAARQRASVLLADVDGEIQARLQAQRHEAFRQSHGLRLSTASGPLRIPGLLDPFVTDAAGEILWPSAPAVKPAAPPTSAAWRRAQQYEFVLQDLPQARIVYEDIAATDAAAAAYALTAAARCADKFGDGDSAARIRQRLLSEVADVPARLRLGASWELALHHEARGELELAARASSAALEWMCDDASPASHAVAAHYRNHFDQLWPRLEALPLPLELVEAWHAARRRWMSDFAAGEARALLEENVLPTLLPAASVLEPGTCRHVPLRAGRGWQVWLLAALPDGGTAGGRLDLARTDSTAIATLENRLQQLGDQAVAIVDTGGASDGLLASLRLSPPLSFRRLAILPGSAVAVTASWRTRLLRWSIILCVGGVLAGVWSGWRRVRREREEGRLKTDFVSNVSHELKTPLTTIRMYVEMLRLKRYESREEADDYLQVVEEESGRLGRMVDRLLDVARMERGERPFDRSATDLAALVAETVASLRAELRDTPVASLDVAVGEALPVVHFDRDALEEVVRNLVLNAIKYSPEPARVRVSLTAADGGVALAVADEGAGIPPAEHERIFERFYRVDGDLIRDVQGSGLGLSLVHHILEAHAGRIHVDSQLGRGSTFTAWLPSSGSEP